MITWPNLGLYGNFGSCEEGSLAALNQDLLLLDTLSQASIKNFVAALPGSPVAGDTYVLTTDKKINVWNGSAWVSITPQKGYLVFDETSNQFYWFDGTNWVLMPVTPGDVVGPASSTDNAIVRWDGITGKLVQDSGILISDTNKLTGANLLSTNFLDGIMTEDSTSTGSNADLGALASMVIRLTNNSLVSVADLDAPLLSTNSRFHILMNETGNKIVIKNNSIIRTGTKADLDLEDEAAIWIAWDNSASQWVVVGGAGSGGSRLVFGTSSAPRDIVAANGIVTADSHISTTSMDQLVYVRGSVAATECIISASPMISLHTKDGARLTLVGTDSTRPVTISDATGLVTKGTLQLNQDSRAVFDFDLSANKWSLVSWSP